jgi:branched-chain amino acid transport system substrate-binding protein
MAQTCTGRLPRRALLAGAAALPFTLRAYAETPVLRIGVLTDLSGQYRDNSGPTSVLAAQQAVEDFQPQQHGFAVEIVSADHGQKPDLGASIVRQWFDRDGVDAVADLNNTAVALAAGTLAREKDKALLISGAASSELTGKYCGANQVHWSPDSYAGPHATGGALLKAGRKKWFLVIADYVFGHSLENGIASLVAAQGGTIVGRAAYPFPGTTDFSSFLVQAQSSGADALGLCCTGGDMEACVKQAREFGLDKTGMAIAALLGFVTEVHSMGLPTAQGLMLAEPFYWDLNDRTRAFTRRFLPKTPNNYPSSLHAGCYSAVTHYMKTAAQMGLTAAKASGRATIAAMKVQPTDDDCFGEARIRADGRFLAPVTLFQCKTPAESRRAWDVYKVLDTIPASQAWHPPDGSCGLMKG